MKEKAISNIREAEKLTIATCQSALTPNMRNEELRWPDFVTRLSHCKHTTETVAEYHAMSRDAASRVKDVGAFVAGKSRDGYRKRDSIVSRCIISLDADHCTSADVAELQKVYADFNYVMHPTHSHTVSAPRVRLLFLASRDMTPEEYEPVARKLASMAGLALFDDTTYQVARLMYWPSMPADARYGVIQGHGQPVDVDALLATYTDWRDCNEWPLSARANDAPRKHADIAEDPLEKSGYIGAFCRAYPMQDCIEKFLADEYTPTDQPDRYSYAHSTTSGGAVIYDNKFLYSHHEKDPVSGRLVNAFDLVRLHKFGELDEKHGIDLPMAKKKSMISMVDLIKHDPLVEMERVKDRDEDFIDYETSIMGVTPEVASLAPARKPEKVKANPPTGNPLKILERNKKGDPVPSLMNAVTILQINPELMGRIGFNEQKQKLVLRDSVPWRECNDNRNGIDFIDADLHQLRGHISRTLNVEFNGTKMADAVAIVADNHKYNPIKDELRALEWDGVPRLDTFLSVHLGAEQNIYTGSCGRKWLVSGVARVFDPGCKADHMLILEGLQGIGKSTFFRVLCLNEADFSDSMRSLEGKGAIESMLGFHIIELGELSTVSKSEIEHVKQFLSAQNDTARMAYARYSKTFPRQCIFGGSTNDASYLRDDTGNRRFWPVKVGEGVTLDVDALRAVKHQLWAEAVVLYRAGEKLYLDDPAAQAIALAEQDARREEIPYQGVIAEWLTQPVPVDFYNHNPDEPGATPYSSETVERERTCVYEIWTRCLGHTNRDDLTVLKSRQIGAAIRSVPGWEATGDMRIFGVLGRHKEYSKKQD